MKVKIRVRGFADDSFAEDAIDAMAAKVIEHFQENVGPHIVAAAQARCPVGEERNFNPRAFRPVQLKPVGALGPAGLGTPGRRLAELHGIEPRERAGLFRQAFGPRTEATGATQFFEGTGKNKGQQPDLLVVSGGTIKGAFRHQPGTLKRSIRLDGVTRSGNRVQAVVRAHAPYAMARHQGFQQWAGSPPGQKPGRWIPGVPFMLQALPNTRDRLLNLKVNG